MSFEEVMQALKAAGTEQNRKVYPRHGVKGEIFGVSFADLGKLKKKIKTDHELAKALWGSGVHDARILALMVADPQRADEALLTAWGENLGNYVVTDYFADYVFQTSAMRQKMDSWTRAEDEWLGQAGWRMVAKCAMQDPSLPDSFFEACLAQIEGEIHTRKNRVRDAMNSALIAIGIRNPALRAKALSASAKIGKVSVDHGQTSCKTPDAGQYILKTVQHQEKKSGERITNSAQAR